MISRATDLIGFGYEITGHTATITHAPTTVNVEITPPSGEVYVLTNLAVGIKAVPASSAGTHYLRIYNNGQNNANLSFSQSMVFTAAYNGAILYALSEVVAGSSYGPDTLDKLNNIVLNGGLMATPDEPLRFAYTNSTDADQTEDLYIWCQYKRYKVL